MTEPYKFPVATPEERAESKAVLMRLLEELPDYTDAAASIWGATTALLYAREYRRSQQ